MDGVAGSGAGFGFGSFSVEGFTGTVLVLRRLLPMAHDGLERWGVDAADRDRLLGIVERRCVEGRNGAQWQADTFHRLYERADRGDALREMTVRYREHMHSNEPVHTWPLD